MFCTVIVHKQEYENICKNNLTLFIYYILILAPLFPGFDHLVHFTVYLPFGL